MSELTHPPISEGVAEGVTEVDLETTPASLAPQPVPVAPAPEFWTLERLIYGLAIALGGGLRIWALGAQPLSAWEASNSWPAWLAAHAIVVSDAPTPNSALFYTFQWLVFWSGVNSDGGARFVSVLAGVLLIALPWWWRGWLGRRAALFLACFWAVDPWLMMFGRLADGGSVAILMGMLVLVSTTQVAFAVQGKAVWRRVFAMAAGLLLISGPLGWNFLVPCGLLIFLLRAPLQEAKLFATPTLVWGLGAALVAGTFFGARLDSLAWLASGANVWLTQFDGSDPGPMLPTTGGVHGLLWPWLRAAVEMAAPFSLGFAGFIVLWRRGESSAMQRPFV